MHKGYSIGVHIVLSWITDTHACGIREMVILQVRRQSKKLFNFERELVMHVRRRIAKKSPEDAV